MHVVYTGWELYNYVIGDYLLNFLTLFYYMHDIVQCWAKLHRYLIARTAIDNIDCVTNLYYLWYNRSSYDTSLKLTRVPCVFFANKNYYRCYLIPNLVRYLTFYCTFFLWVGKKVKNTNAIQVLAS